MCISANKNKNGLNSLIFRQTVLKHQNLISRYILQNIKILRIKVKFYGLTLLSNQCLWYTAQLLQIFPEKSAQIADFCCLSTECTKKNALKDFSSKNP